MLSNTFFGLIVMLIFCGSSLAVSRHVVSFALRHVSRKQSQIIHIHIDDLWSYAVTPVLPFSAEYSPTFTLINVNLVNWTNVHLGGNVLEWMFAVNYTTLAISFVCSSTSKLVVIIAYLVSIACGEKWVKPTFFIDLSIVKGHAFFSRCHCSQWLMLVLIRVGLA